MGKKKKHNKKIKKAKDFKKRFCQSCCLCNKQSDVFFCYDYKYKKDPERFIKIIYPRLKKIERWPWGFGLYELQAFYATFCMKNACVEMENGSEDIACKHMNFCMESFQDQLSGGTGLYNIKNKKYDKKNKFKNKPKPCFITNGDKDWIETMESIINGNYNKQQNNCEGIDTGD